jgi:hypothetical protein
MPEDRDHTTVEQAGSDGEANPVTPRRASGRPGRRACSRAAPGHRDSSAGPGVRTAQGASPEDGIVQDDKAPAATPASPRRRLDALAAPGHPDGEVDTRP